MKFTEQQRAQAYQLLHLVCSKLQDEFTLTVCERSLYLSLPFVSSLGDAELLIQEVRDTPYEILEMKTVSVGLVLLGAMLG